MKALKMVVLLAALLAGLSCVQSLHPLFEDEDLVFEPGLVGAWRGEDSESTWIFEKEKSNEYELTVEQAEFENDSAAGTMPDKVPGETARFQARLGKLGGRLFLDLFPESKGNPRVRNDLFNLMQLPVHTFWRLTLEKDSLRLDVMSIDWLERMLKEGKVSIAAVETEDRLVLTATTEELKKLVARYSEDDDAFPPSDGNLRRIR
jgi:hypothetical protein